MNTKVLNQTSLVSTFDAQTSVENAANKVFAEWDKNPSTVLTREELASFVASKKGSTFVTIQTITEAQKSKAQKAQKVWKFSHVNCNLNWNYANSVNSLANKEAGQPVEKVEPKKRTWGTRIISPYHSLIEHKGEFYLAMKPLQTLHKPVFFTQKEKIKYVYFDIVAKSEIEHLLKPPSQKSSTQAHLIGEVRERDYRIASIYYISIENQKFKLID